MHIDIGVEREAKGVGEKQKDREGEGVDICGKKRVSRNVYIYKLTNP